MEKTKIMNWILLLLWIGVLFNVIALLLGRGKYPGIVAGILAILAFGAPHMQNYLTSRQKHS